LSKIFYKNAFSNILAVSSNIITPLILIPVLTKSLGLNMYGDYMALLGLIFLFVAVLDFGLDMYLAKEVAILNDNKTKLNYLLSSYITIKIIGSIFIIPFLLFMLPANMSLYVFLLCWLLVLNLTLKPFAFFCGLELYTIQSKIEISSRFLLVLFVLIGDFNNNGLEKALEAQLISVLASNIAFYSILKYRYCLTIGLLRLGKVLVLVKLAFGFYSARLFVNIYIQSSTYLVSLFVKSDIVAIYSIAIQVYKLGQAVIGAVAKVLYTSTIKSKDFRHVAKVTLGILSALLLFFPVVYFFGAIILTTLLRIDGQEVLPFILPLYLSLVFVTLSSFWGYPVLVSLEKEKYAHLGIFLSSITYYIAFIICVLFFEFDIYLAITCIVISDMMACLLRIYFALKFVDITKVFSNHLK
jgi:PST family polysaccharide transporter